MFQIKINGVVPRIKLFGPNTLQGINISQVRKIINSNMPWGGDMWSFPGGNDLCTKNHIRNSPLGHSRAQSNHGWYRNFPQTLLGTSPYPLPIGTFESMILWTSPGWICFLVRWRIMFALIYQKKCKFSPPLVTQRLSVRRSEEGYGRKLTLSHVHHKKSLRNYGCNMPFSRNLQNSHLLPSMLASPNIRNSALFFKCTSQ